MRSTIEIPQYNINIEFYFASLQKLNHPNMKKILFYLIIIVGGCSLFFAGMLYETNKKKKAVGTTEPISYNIFEHNKLLDALIYKDESVSWGIAAVDSILDLYKELNHNIQIDEYPTYITQVWQNFGEYPGETNRDHDLFYMAVHRFQYLYVNYLYNQLPQSDVQVKLNEAIISFQTWEKTLISLYTNNVLLGYHAHRYYTFECATITLDAMDNLCGLLYWLDCTLKWKETNTDDLYEHKRFFLPQHYHDILQITEERLMEIRDDLFPPSFQPTFDNDPDLHEPLAPKHGKQVIAEEEQAWNALSEALDAYAIATGLEKTDITNKWSDWSEWERWKTIVRLNTLWTVVAPLDIGF